MLGELKNRLLLVRAEGALTLADMALERGEAHEALRQFAHQARDLGRRNLDAALRRQAWFGALAALRLIAERAQDAPAHLDAEAVREAVAGVLPCERAELPTRWRRYDDFRALILALLSQREAQAAAQLTWTLSQWFSDDPRPLYARGRALELQLAEASGLDAQHKLASEALEAYREALGAASTVGALRRWRPALHTRMARLLSAHLAARDPKQAQEALKLVEALTPGEVRRLAPAQRFHVASLWLRSKRAMLRVRALDMLGELMASDEALRDAGLATLADYLEGLDWSYYSTEQDRVRAILGESPSRRARRMVAYLDLLQALRGEMGRHSLPERGHLQHLLDAERAAAPGGLGERFYALAMTLSAQDAPPLGDALASHGLAGRSVAVPLDGPLGMALASLRQRHRPERGDARRLLDAFARPDAQVPHVQAAFALLLPVLIAQWRQWAELQTEMRRGVDAFLMHAPTPSWGFAVVGQALAGYGEWALAQKAARRALVRPDGEDPAALERLLLALARRDLECGGVEEAVAWLLPVWSLAATSVKAPASRAEVP